MSETLNIYNRPIEVLAKLPWYTEGPAADHQGNIFFTTLKGEQIFKIDTAGTLSVWAKAKCPNGQIILPSGEHLICDSGISAISRFSSDGILLGHDIDGSCNGEKLYAPNDLVADAAGGIYFTDSIRHQGKVCYYTPGGICRIIARDLDFPNGIALSHDGKTLFVAESYKNRILKFHLDTIPAPELRPEVFAELPAHGSGDIIKNLPDGIKIDTDGNMWVAHYGMGAVQVLSPLGKLTGSITVAFPLASNLFLTGNAVIITGGYREPGPGGVLKL